MCNILKHLYDGLTNLRHHTAGLMKNHEHISVPNVVICNIIKSQLPIIK